ncbi:MAG: TetR/AcrR family transcriptional regulator [Candidatus Izemoplasmatales bacterium]|jgi:AcrR family transcriptional regulator
MPSKTFYNLQKHKQKRIIDAAKKEFSEAEFAEVSINRIIKEAEISRGSFYMYFSDKLDLLMYLLDEYKHQFSITLKSIGKSANGDINKIIIATHDYFHETMTLDDNRRFLSNFLASSLKGSIKRDCRDFEASSPLSALGDLILEYVDKGTLDNRFQDDLKNLVEAHLIIMKHTLASAYANKTTIAKSREELENKLRILRYGYERKEEQ